MPLLPRRVSRPRAGRAGRRSILVALLAALVSVSAACTGATDPCGGDPTGCTRVLFLGNSYTYVNDLPGTFARLAASGGHTVATDSVAFGGATLADVLASGDRRQRMASTHWSFIVLQEQSQIPSSPQLRDQDMYPAARSLVGQVQAAGALPVLFETWAHRDGWPEAGIATYTQMQTQIDAAYEGLARELEVADAPVGRAWAVVHSADPGLTLWVDDGSHPTPAGTYLAACVFYATIFHADPTGLSFTDGLSDGDARYLQTIAEQAVSLE